MKTTILFLLLIGFSISGSSVSKYDKNNLNALDMPAEKKTEIIKVYGNCDMCKERIEKAAKSIDGVKKAVWNKETKELKVTFNPEVTDVESIEKEIAAVGHDTDNVKAKDEVYNNLHSCCQYDRPVKK